MGLKRLLNKGIAGVALVALAGACSHSGEPVREPGYPAVARPVVRPPARMVVALPALLGLTVEELARHLGPPQPVPTPLQALLSQMPSTAPADSLRFFRFRTLNLLVNFDAGTRRLNDLLLIGSNEGLLMQRTGLLDDAANYLLLPVFHNHRPTKLLGLRVVPIDPVSLR